MGNGTFDRLLLLALFTRLVQRTTFCLRFVW